MPHEHSGRESGEDGRAVSHEHVHVHVHADGIVHAHAHGHGDHDHEHDEQHLPPAEEARGES